jgi:DNA modification methylase
MSFVEQVGCVTIYCADNLKVLPTLSRVTAVVTDPPYGISFMSKKWDYDVPSVELWKACLEAMSPGAHLLSFAAPRTQHRIAVNIEDAGFEIRDSLAWVFGSGMPKGLDVSKALDKELKAERKVVGVAGKSGSKRNCMSGDFTGGEYMQTEPSTPEAKLWDGYNVSLKPAYEPIIMARKSLDGTVAQNVLKHGCGGLNIGECRVETSDNLNGGTYSPGGKSAPMPGDTRTGAALGMFQPGAKPKNGYIQPPGRYPANFIHDGSDEVIALFPENRPGMSGGGKHKSGHKKGMFGAIDCEHTLYGDQGSAARFFYQAKVSSSERSCNGAVQNNHPTIKPKALMSYLLKLVKQPERNLILDPFAGSGSTGLAALELGIPCILIEREREYFDIALQRLQAHHNAMKAA